MNIKAIIYSFLIVCAGFSWIVQCMEPYNEIQYREFPFRSSSPCPPLPHRAGLATLLALRDVPLRPITPVLALYEVPSRPSTPVSDFAKMCSKLVEDVKNTRNQRVNLKFGTALSSTLKLIRTNPESRERLKTLLLSSIREIAANKTIGKVSICAASFPYDVPLISPMLEILTAQKPAIRGLEINYDEGSFNQVGDQGLQAAADSQGS